MAVADMMRIMSFKMYVLQVAPSGLGSLFIWFTLGIHIYNKSSLFYSPCFSAQTLNYTFLCL